MSDLEASRGPDGPDEIYVGTVGPIPIIENDDPRFDHERDEARAAAAKADAMHTPADLQRGLLDKDPEVRWRVVPRLVARGRDHNDTLSSLLVALHRDASPKVRSSIAESLYWFNPADVVPALLEAAVDADADVRESARESLAYFGEEPPTSPDLT